MEHTRTIIDTYRIEMRRPKRRDRALFEVSVVNENLDGLRIRRRTATQWREVVLATLEWKAVKEQFLYLLEQRDLHHTHRRFREGDTNAAAQEDQG